MHPTAPRQPNPLRTGAIVALVLVLAGLLLVALKHGGYLPGSTATPPDAAHPAAAESAVAATFVGSNACADCHREEFTRWQGSQHAVAMQVADERTVLGDFNNARFRNFGVTTEFSRRDGKFMVRTEGPDGKMADFEVRHTFGVYPLQQYLIELPRGHVQALSIAWDARPKDAGGQRWFHLYPNERIGARDELHWTKRQQNWNYMCADCHSTNLQKNYDAATDTYATKWSEISVGCEACHGPGSAHVAIARQAAADRMAMPMSGLTVALDERRGVAWTIDPQTGIAARNKPRTSDKEIDVCAQCHARRGQFSNGYHAGEPFMDHYLPSLLTDPLYHPDGQQRDEDYNWASLLSSRMYSKGVTCSDCHEPHGGKLRAAGNIVCAQCHLASKYDVPGHHFHGQGTPGAACTSCHMQTVTYMGVDPRHDHSFRIPRPDLTVRIGVPNACSACHKDRSAQWAADEIRKRFPQPKPGFQDFAETFAASDQGRPEVMGLSQIVANQDESPIARASALARLSQWISGSESLAAEAALQDRSPLVRMAALDAYENLPPPERRAAVPLLSDASRAVRTHAARLLAQVPADQLNDTEKSAYGKAAAEYVAAERFNADRPENRTNLGGYLAERGDYAAAEAEFRGAIALDDQFVPAWVNLADLMRLQQREPDAESVLREGLRASPKDASLHHALGLSLVRQGGTATALDEFRRATELAPADARFAYVYGVALHSSGKAAAGTAVLERALRAAPSNRDLLTALASFEAEAGHAEPARVHATRLLELYPGDPTGQAILASLPSATR
jgi:Flp pilus assembly protein TadD